METKWEEVTQKVIAAVKGPDEYTWSAYIRIDTENDIVLDGVFTVEDLETIVKIIREAKEKP